MPNQQVDRNDSVKRRRFLRTLSASGGIATGLTGISAAKGGEGGEKIDDAFIQKAKELIERRKELEAKYEDPKQLRTTIRNTSRGLLDKMASEGYLQSASLNNLPLGSTLDTNAIQPEEGKQGVAVTVLAVNDTLTALIMVSINTDNHEMGIYIQPEAKKQYAIISPKNGGRVRYLGDTSQKTTAELRNGGKNIRSKDNCHTYVQCHKNNDSVCHIDASEYCTHVWYQEIEYKCCDGLGCWEIGTLPCVGNGHDQCHEHEGPLCCCV